MRIIYTILLLFFLGPAFSQQKAKKQVWASLEEQVKAWNEGKLEDAMAYYYNSPDLLWISRAGIEKGFTPVFNSYIEEFRDRSKMGTFTYQPLETQVLSAKTVLYVYRWKIELAGKKLMGGVSSQIWKKTGRKWTIHAEHAS
ncbi:nuclear transport factor 2 family protein [Flavihumibacter sp. R14]|nr:nuclear transport factor 2 family protein [Flavihumibacter soli]